MQRRDRRPACISSRPTARPASSLLRKSCKCRHWRLTQAVRSTPPPRPTARCTRSFTEAPPPAKRRRARTPRRKLPLRKREPNLPDQAKRRVPPWPSIPATAPASSSIPRPSMSGRLHLITRAASTSGPAIAARSSAWTAMATALCSSRATRPRFAPSTSTTPATSLPGPMAVGSSIASRRKAKVLCSTARPRRKSPLSPWMRRETFTLRERVRSVGQARHQRRVRSLPRRQPRVAP